VGNATEEVQKLASKARNNGKFDLIFIDHSKSQYREVLDDCFKLLRAGGLLIADNITFTGCQDFKDAVLNHRELKTEIINIRDGLSCSQKLAVPKTAYPSGIKPRPKF
jgi:predicted O-methyltransferase YrrM